jgi:hypothetical protein
VFPSTRERIVVVTGTAEQLMAVNALIWHLLANNFEAYGKGVRAEVWSPTVAIEELRRGVRNDVHCSGRVTVPANAAGLLIGRNGDTFRCISNKPGAHLSMVQKDDPAVAETQERVVTISGPKVSCIRAVECVIETLFSDPSVSQYVHRGTQYGRGGGQVSGFSTLDFRRRAHFHCDCVWFFFFGRDGAWTRRRTTWGVHGVKDRTAAGARAGDGWGGDAVGVGGAATGPGLCRVDLGTLRAATRSTRCRRWRSLRPLRRRHRR